MGLKLANNASGLLAAGVSDSATTLTLQAGHGSRFPTISAPGDFFPITVVRAQNPSQYENMLVTGRTGDTLTVQREQEGTARLSFSPGDIVELRLTAGTLEDNFPQMSNRAAKNFKFSIAVADGKDKLSFTGPNSTETILLQSDAQTNALDATAGRLLKVGAFGLGVTSSQPQWPLSDLDDIPASVPSGMYCTTGSHTNKPEDLWGEILWMRHTADTAFMLYAHPDSSAPRLFFRVFRSGSWGSWQEIPYDGRLKTVGGQSLIGNGDILGNVENYPPASQSEAEAGAANDRYMTPLRTKQAIDALAPKPIGDGQTWQDLKTSRAFKTTYTNTTGRPIAVAVTGHSPSGATIALWAVVNGTQIYPGSPGHDGGTSFLFFIVPPGATYSVIFSGASSLSLGNWSELR